MIVLKILTLLLQIIGVALCIGVPVGILVIAMVSANDRGGTT